VLKIDIEGAELEMLLGTPESVLRRCDQITVEFHDFMDRSQAVDVRACIHRLRSFGFRPFRCRILNHSDMLFVHERCLKTWLFPFFIWLGVIRNDLTLEKVRNFFTYAAQKALK